ncbi:MAG: YibE/F family protein [Firmicutes bacterium]|nr:YibE/F family protein [Bacillota bacterium]
MRRLPILIALPLLALMLIPGIALAQDDFGDETPVFVNEIERGRVLEVVTEEDIDDDWFVVGRQLLLVEITSGTFRGQKHEIENLHTGVEFRDLYLQAGDQVLLMLELDPEQGRLEGVYLHDIARDRYLYILAAAFVVGLVLVARIKGIKALATLLFMGVVIIYLLLPLILRGHDPVLLTLAFASLITVFTLTVISGFNAKTLAAIGGTVGGLIIAALMAWVFGEVSSLTGFSSEEAQMLQYAELPGELNIRGLLFAGIIIGALGAVLDVAMSIAASVAEVRAANPRLTVKELFESGYNVGKDILGTMVNTLILAYTGGALPLLLLFMAYDMSYLQIINMDLIATEVVRSLAGSFGLLAAVPLTAILAAVFISRQKRRPGGQPRA